MLFVQEKRKEMLAEVIRENQKALYRMAYSYVHNEDAAKEVVQEAVYAAFKNLSKMREESTMKTWLMRICINKAIDRLRQLKKPTEATLELKDYQAAPAVSQSWQYGDLFHAIDQLDPQLKTVIMLRYFEDQKFETIAAITHTNVNTVKARVYKALKLLKIEMEKEDEL